MSVTTPDNDELLAMGYRLWRPGSPGTWPTLPPKYTPSPQHLVAVMPDGAVQITETGLEANAWSLCRGHWRRAQLAKV